MSREADSVRAGQGSSSRRALLGGLSVAGAGAALDAVAPPTRANAAPAMAMQGSLTNLLFYSRQTGQGVFYATNGAGDINELQVHNGWDRTWSHIIPGNFGGAGLTDLLFYNQNTGEAIFYTNDGAGELHELRAHNTWDPGWTHIVPGNFGGDGFTDLLFYSRATGQGLFYATDGKGGMRSLRAHEGWDHTWTHILPGAF